MKRNLIAFALTLHFAACSVSAQNGQPPPPPPGGGGGMHLLPRGADKALNLTDEQSQQLKGLEAEVKARVEKILTPEQLTQLKDMRPQPPGGSNSRGERPLPPDASGNVKSAAARPSAEDAPAATSKPLPAGVTRLPVVFSGGHETDPVDHGRPVVLVAAALGVKTEVFREAFSHVHPAGPGSGGPSESEARANKAALMNALGKYGVTNDRLNTVSNFYRYPPGSRSLWKNQTATASALVKDGAIVGYEIINGGYGYTTPPTVTVPGMAGATAKVEIAYGKDMETNGSVAAITTADAQ